MNTTSHIAQILDYARLAPSVHNTQPWKFQTDETTISLLPAPERFLDNGDPTKRELWISLGVCLETILQAANGLGLTATIKSVQTNSLNSPVAVIEVSLNGAADQTILTAITNRHSYRGKMRPLNLPDTFAAECQRTIADIGGVSALLAEDPKDIQQIADYTNKGMRLALSSPAFRRELAELIHPNWSKSRTGMHGFVLNKGMLGSVWEKISMKHGLSLKAKAYADKQKVLESSALLFVAANGDVPHFWLNAGRAYMRLALLITRYGFAHSTIAAPIEAASFHEDIEKILSTTGRIQTMMRIGSPVKTPVRSSTRLHVDELLT